MAIPSSDWASASNIAVARARYVPDAAVNQGQQRSHPDNRMGLPTRDHPGRQRRPRRPPKQSIIAMAAAYAEAEDVTVADTGEWRSDRLRDADETVRWQPMIQVTAAGRWAGPTDDGRWVVGTPDRHTLLALSPAGVIALLPLLERPMTEVAAALGVSSLTQHGLAFERVVDAALDERSSGHWAADAIAWLNDGFPVVWYRDALRRIVTDKKRVDQRSRQAAARLLAHGPPGPD